MEEITAGIVETVAGMMKRKTAEIGAETRLAEDLGMKSGSRIVLAALLEQRFGVTIGNFEIRKPKTISDLVSLIRSKL